MCIFKEFEKLEKEFHDVMHEYPLFLETVDDIYDKDIKEINQIILNTPIKSLDGNTPKEAFIKVFNEDLYQKLLK